MLFDLKNGLITLVYGPAASGKTTIAFETILNYAKDGRVLFIDSENGFSADRLKQLDPGCDGLLENVVVLNIKNFSEQVQVFDNLETLMKVGKFGAIIIDTLGMQYRKALQEENHQYVNEKIFGGLNKLRKIAFRNDIPVLILNQIYTKPDGENVGVGGNMVRNFGKYLIELKKNPRRAVMLKPLGDIVHFEIHNSGIKKI
ncbi:AAA family ATPase [Candidatus Woesearchaeota archaeon]|jgi:DNA repair protein RadB|nr:AAA family ATPase [Candidatus Woesearchaeota archaeon]MBT4835314.1 AAA family ATPase [Candidatus Woesearchaeota archaeon]MBT7169561.1 AAA family ATPase [Candidatus Woesearchaeota archaeon]MBT7474363.1 AAA family ATPase [Candidatus Woesearchaeota archaeon]